MRVTQLLTTRIPIGLFWLLLAAFVILGVTAARDKWLLVQAWERLEACGRALSVLPAQPSGGAGAISTPAASEVIAPGERIKGGWIMNPYSAVGPLCLNEMGPATLKGGDYTVCLAPGQAYNLVPDTRPVSVISADQAHVFSYMAFH